MKTGIRKTGEGEFFHMTYLANILTHPKKNRLILLFGNYHYEKLYKEAVAQGLPFYKWNGWINKKLEEAYKQYRQQKNRKNSSNMSQLILEDYISQDLEQRKQINAKESQVSEKD